MASGAKKEKILVDQNFHLFPLSFQKPCLLGSLTLKAPFTKTVVFAANIDQDQAAQNVQPDLNLHCLPCLNAIQAKDY